MGIDPGLQKTGWGIIKITNNVLSYLNHGVLKTESSMDLARRLNYLSQSIADIIKDHSPVEVAVEEIFVNSNPLSALKLGMARGAILSVPPSFNLSVYEYSANKIKKSVVGNGHADKNQVIRMVQILLPKMPSNISSDSADALATAICHANH